MYSHPMLPGSYWNTGVAPRTPVRPVRPYRGRSRARAGFIPHNVRNAGPEWYDIYARSRQATNMKNAGPAMDAHIIYGRRGKPRGPYRVSRDARRADPWNITAEDWGRTARPTGPYRPSREARRADPWNITIEDWGRKGRPRPLSYYSGAKYRRADGGVDEDYQYASNPFLPGAYWNTGVAPRTPDRPIRSRRANKEQVVDVASQYGAFMNSDGVGYENVAGPWGTACTPYQTDEGLTDTYCPDDVQNVRPPGIEWLKNEPRDVQNVAEPYRGGEVRDIQNAAPDLSMEGDVRFTGDYSDHIPSDRLNAPPFIIRPYDMVGTPPNRMNAGPHMDFDETYGPFDGGCPEGMYFCPIDKICKHEENEFNQSLWFNK